MGASSCAARNAAFTAMLRMLPPVISSRAERLEVERLPSPASGGKTFSQIRLRLRRVGEREVDQEAQPAQEGAVEGGLPVGGQDGQAAVVLHALQQVVDLDVGVAVVAVLDLGALAEQRVGLVEEEDRAAPLGRVEDRAQVLLGLADVLV